MVDGGDTKTRAPLRSRFATAAIMAGVVLAVSFVLDMSGMTPAADGAFESLAYSLRGARDGDVDVVFVQTPAVGEGSLDANEFERVLQVIVDASAKAVIVLDDQGIAVDGLARVAADNVFRHEAGSRVIAPLVFPSASGRTRRVPTSSPAGTSLIVRAARAQGVPVSQDGVDVNFLGRPLAAVTAKQIAAGVVPKSTFAKRYVVVGSASRVAGTVMTPVGEMSPAQVHANALLTLVHDVELRSVPAFVVTLLSIFCALLAFILASASRPVHSLAGIVSASLLLLFVAFGLFAWFDVVLPPSQLVVAVAIAAMFSYAAERFRVSNALSDVSRSIEREERLFSSSQASSNAADDEFFERFIHESLLFVDYRSSLVADLEPGKWHLRIQATAGCTNESLHERRRDIRRSPYRPAYLMAKPVWSERQFMKDDSETLVVPLMTFGKVIGFWIVNFASREDVTDKTMTKIVSLSKQLSLNIERRRMVSKGRAHGVLAGRYELLSKQVRALERGAVAAMSSMRELSQLIDGLPTPILRANLWGNIQSTNQAMVRLLRDADNYDTTDNELVTVLRRLTGKKPEELRDHLRMLLESRQPVVLASQMESGGVRVEEIVLSAQTTAPMPDTPEEMTGFVVVAKPIYGGKFQLPLSRSPRMSTGRRKPREETVLPLAAQDGEE